MRNKNKRGEHFNFALVAIFLSISISIIAFMTENNRVTGFVTASPTYDVAGSNIRNFNNIDDMRSLSKGNYYIDGNGIVYWLDDESRPAIAKVSYIRDENRNRQVYVDNDGNIGYVIK